MLRVGPLCLLTLLLLPATSSSQPEGEPRRLTVPGENHLLQARLDFARKLASEQKWMETINAYQRLERESGEQLLAFTSPREQVAGCTRSLQVQRVSQLELSSLNEPALKLYQARVEPQARKWLEVARAEQDEKLLRRLVTEALGSPSAALALELLGDLAFERGDLEAACNWWRWLAEPASEHAASTTGRLRQPAVTNPARIRARLLLATIFRGQPLEAERELQAFRRLHGEERGNIAGESGRYADILTRWLQRGRPLHDPPGWFTFGGDAARSLIAAFPPPRLWSQKPSWRVPLTAPPKEGTVLSLEQRTYQLRFFPIIAEGCVAVTDGSSVRSHDLRTGQRLLQHGRPAPERVDLGRSEKEPVEQIERHFLTYADRRLFAVLTRPEAPHAGNHLTCLRLRAGAGPESELWRREPPQVEGKKASFAGPPLVCGERLWIVSEFQHSNRPQLLLVCHDSATGQELWRQPLCGLAEDNDPANPIRPERLLTLAGKQLVCCTESGLIVAADRWTGRIIWAVRYPSHGLRDEGLLTRRESGSCLYHGHRVYVAPRDADRLLCLDPDTGALLWHRERIELVHLLGCSNGRLIFTTPTGLRALDARTGTDAWVQPEEGKLPPLGRGLLAGDWVVWPTGHPEYPLRLVHASDGRPEHAGLGFDPTSLRHVVAGNFALAEDVLVVATETELLGYVGEKDKGDHRGAGKAEPLPPTPSPKRGGGAEAPLPPTPSPKRGGGAAEVKSAALRTAPSPPSPLPPGERGEKAPFTPPLLRSWEVRDARLLIPISVASDVVYTLRHRTLQARSPVTGAVTWEKVLAFAPTWFARAGGDLFLGDTQHLLALDKSGRQRWHAEATERIENCHLVGERLFHLSGKHRLHCRNAATGRRAWSFSAPGAELRPLEGGALGELYFADDERLLLQTTGGQRVLLNSRSGEIIRRTAGSREPWQQAPLRVGKDGLLVIEDRTRVELLDSNTGTVRWTYQPRLPTTLSGQPFQPLPEGGALLLFVPRGHGCSVERVDLTTGKNLWDEQPRLLRSLPDSELIQDEAVYYVSANVLYSRDLTTGKLLHEIPLRGPGERWQLRPFGKDLLLQCTPPRPWAQILWLGQGPLFVPLGYQSGAQAILDWRTANGQFLQRLNLSEGATELRVQGLPDGLVVEARGVVTRFKGER